MGRAETSELADGTVTVQPHGGGWYLVQVGRRRGTRRFNLTADESAALVAELCRTVPGALAAADAVARETAPLRPAAPAGRRRPPLVGCPLLALGLGAVLVGLGAHPGGLRLVLAGAGAGPR